MLVAIDYIVIAMFFGLTLAVGFLASRQAKRSSRQFFVAEKSLPWWVIGFTMVAACASAEHMIGQVGYAKDAGLVISNWDFASFPSYVLMIFIFLPLYMKSGITTIPEYLEKRYSATTRMLFAVYTVFNNACITLVMVLALGAIALKYFIGLDERLALILLIVTTGLYTIYGGMLSVAWTQTLQYSTFAAARKRAIRCQRHLPASGAVPALSGLAGLYGGCGHWRHHVEHRSRDQCHCERLRRRPVPPLVPPLIERPPHDRRGSIDRARHTDPGLSAHIGRPQVSIHLHLPPKAWCILAIPIMLVFTYGALRKRATHRSANATFIFVAPFVAVPFVFGNVNDNFLALPFVAARVHLFNFAFVLWLAAGAFMALVSLFTQVPSRDAITTCLWKRELLRGPQGEYVPPRLYQRVGFWCCLAAIFYLLIYSRYW